MTRALAALRSGAFYAAFYGGSVGYVLAALVVVALAPRHLPAIVAGWSRWHRTCARYLAGIVVQETGRRADGPALYAIRHESFFEAIDLPALLDHPVVFAKQELFRIPGWGRAASAYGVVPVAREAGAAALRAMFGQARAFSRSGRPLVIFPEGTRVPHGRRAPLQAGFAGLYKVLHLPVVPVAVDSGPLYQRAIKRPGIVHVHFGEAIPPGLPREEVEARVLAGINALNPLNPA